MRSCRGSGSTRAVARRHFGIKSDLATYGKIIGGGMPIGVTQGALGS